MKKILLGQNHLHTLGGSETFTYTMAQELVRLGHHVDILTMQEGIMSEMIKTNLGCSINNISNSYDIAYINHTTIVHGVMNLFPGSNIVQTCHGIFPQLEQPVQAQGIRHVSISKEVQNYLSSKSLESTLIHNGIDCDVFHPEQQPSKKINKMFSLSQSDQFNQTLLEIGDELGIKVEYNNKFTSPRFDIQNVIKTADLVVSLGRGAYEGMACGKPVLIADQRPYQPGLMDGMINSDNIDGFLENNCSGRKVQQPVTKESLTNEIRKYDHFQGNKNREYVLENLNIQKQVQEYLKL
jgi:glycosyltransferase involved in cell wall biosynthesis